jgi:hypothetical protein
MRMRMRRYRIAGSDWFFRDSQRRSIAGSPVRRFAGSEYSFNVRDGL